MCCGHVNSLCDGSINVRDDDPVVPVPQIDGSLTAAGTLVLSGHAEDHLIGPLPQVQTLLKKTTNFSEVSQGD